MMVLETLNKETTTQTSAAEVEKDTDIVNKKNSTVNTNLDDEFIRNLNVKDLQRIELLEWVSFVVSED